jgi:hypothetical protein
MSWLAIVSGMDIVVSSGILTCLFLHSQSDLACFSKLFALSFANPEINSSGDRLRALQ